ncbi:hypothetical protein I317_07915 [Kwoniella heveanensis CBS 569]|nr:hypothetical protein I317_07915 [Kwoniella heveanensis CBS 569]
MASAPLISDEGLKSVRPGRSAAGDKLPIYPTPESIPTVTLIETPNPIVPYITESREAVTSVLAQARGYLQSGVGSWIGFERKVEREVKSVLPADESLTPGLIYVLIAGLSGSVLTRTRSLPIRFLAPPLFTLAAAPYFLPKTSHNIRKYLSDVEDRNFPEFAARHDHFVQTGVAHFNMTLGRLSDAGDSAKEWSHTAFEKVENTTGLKLGQVVERAEKEKERIAATIQQQQKIDQAKASSAVDYERVGYIVEQKPVAEVVVPVVPEEKKRAV